MGEIRWITKGNQATRQVKNREVTMPKVGKKKFPYTKRGRAAAKTARAKMTTKRTRRKRY